MRWIALALLALTLLAGALPAAAQDEPPTPAQLPPVLIDVPPVFAIDFPPQTRVTWRIVWREESNATDRWLVSPRRGLLRYYGPEVQIPVYVDDFDLDDWRPGEHLTLCRRWVNDPIFGVGDVTVCHDRVPWPLNSVFLPALAAR